MPHAPRMDSWTSIAPISKPAPISSRPTASRARRSCSPSSSCDDKTHELNVAGGAAGPPGGGRIFDHREAALRRRIASGPRTKSITLRGDVTFDQLSDSYYAQAKGLIEGGVDLLLIETGSTRATSRPALFAVQQLERELRHPHSADDFGHHRALGRDARRSAGRCFLRLGRACRSACRSA